MVLDHACDIQVFGCDEPIRIYEFTGGLMMKVRTLITDLPMKPGKRNSSLPPVVRTFRLRGKLTLLLLEFLLGGLQVLRICYCLTRRKNSEIMYANIYADGLVRY